MRPIGLATRLFVAQVAVVMAAATALALTVVPIAPGLFLEHLAMTGERAPAVQQHALEALGSSVGLAFLAAAAAAILAAVLLSWFLTRRISEPIEELAAAAGAVAAGKYDIRVPTPGFGPELAELSADLDSPSRAPSLKIIRGP